MATKGKNKRVGPITFARQVRAEGEKVIWTSRQETIQATIMVIIMSILIALFLFVADWFINLAVSAILNI